MLTAKSMYHGGELVQAIDVNLDFDSFKELGLLCPFCNEPVFLCGETVRQSSKTKKLSYIQPHFKHFPGGDPTDLDCEKRYFTPEGKRYLDAMRAERRGQRLELFNRYFWEIVSNTHLKSQRGGGSYAYADKAAKAAKAAGFKDFTAFLLLAHTAMRVDQSWKEDWQDAILHELKYLYLPPEDKYWESVPVEVKNAFISLCPGTDRRIQELICFEALGFLSLNKSFNLFKKLALVGLFLGELKAKRNPFNPGTGKAHEIFRKTQFGIAYILAITPWQRRLEEKAKLKEETRGKGFSLKVGGGR